MNTKLITGVAVLVVLVAVAVSIRKDDRAGNPIRLGAIISQTGVAAKFGEMSKLSIDLAVNEINAKGGVGGRLVEVVVEDDATDPKTAAGLYQKLSPSVDAIIGSNFDFVTQPMFALAKEGGIAVVSPSNPRIPGAFDTNPNAFVMMSDFSEVVGAFKDYLSKETYSKLGILRFDSAFSAEIARVLEGMNKELGKGDITVETYKQIGNNDFRTAILKLKSAGVDLVFLDMIGPDPLTFINQSKQLGYSPKIITHVGLTDAMAVTGTDPKAFDGIVALDWNVTTDEFAGKFRKAYGMEPTNSANRSYEAVYVLAEAVANAGSKAQIAEYLVGRKFETPNGPFEFNAEHSAKNTLVKLRKVEEGKFVDYE